MDPALIPPLVLEQLAEEARGRALVPVVLGQVDDVVVCIRIVFLRPPRHAHRAVSAAYGVQGAAARAGYPVDLVQFEIPPTRAGLPQDAPTPMMATPARREGPKPRGGPAARHEEP